MLNGLPKRFPRPIHQGGRSGVVVGARKKGSGQIKGLGNGLGMGQQIDLGQQTGFLLRILQVQRGDVLNQVLELLNPVLGLRDLLAEGFILTPEPPALMKGFPEVVETALVNRAPHAIEELALGFGLKQGLMLILSVNLHQERSDTADEGGGGQKAVDKNLSGSVFFEGPTDDEGVGVIFILQSGFRQNGL